MTGNSNHREYSFSSGNEDIVIFVHGILGSPGRFRGMAETLSAIGFDCLALLLPGHGGTARSFYHTPYELWPAYVKQRVREEVKTHRRVFLVGHSLGGLMSLDCAADGGIAGVVVINTPLAFKLNLKRITTSMRTMLNHNARNGSYLSASRELCSVSDARLYEYLFWIPQYLNMYRYAKRTKRKLREVQTKALIVQSAMDESIQLKSAIMLKTGLVNAHAEMMELKDSYHGCFDERDDQMLIREVLRFVASA